MHESIFPVGTAPRRLVSIILLAATSILVPGIALSGSAPGEAAPEQYVCSEPARGGERDAILYHFVFWEGGWFRNSKFVWVDRGVGLQIKVDSNDLIEGEAASTDHMPDHAAIDRCFSDELERQPTYDLNAVRVRCQRRAALSPETVPIKLVIDINRRTGDFKVTRTQSKRLARYNTEAHGTCRRP